MPEAVQDKLTVYFDGSCPLCRAEIGHYRRLRGAEGIAFIDVSDPAADLMCEADRCALMARFHVREADGRLYSGAEAFGRIWARLPAWRAAALILRVPGALWIVERAYRGFLRVRPAVSRRLARLQRGQGV